MNEQTAIDIAKLGIADLLLADLIDEKIARAQALVNLYDLTKDKADLDKAEQYTCQAKQILDVRKILGECVDEFIATHE